MQTATSNPHTAMPAIKCSKLEGSAWKRSRAAATTERINTHSAVDHRVLIANFLRLERTVLTNPPDHYHRGLRPVRHTKKTRIQNADSITNVTGGPAHAPCADRAPLCRVRSAETALPLIPAPRRLCTNVKL